MDHLDRTGVSLECSVPLNIKVSPSRNILQSERGSGDRIDRGNHIFVHVARNEVNGGMMTLCCFLAAT